MFTNKNLFSNACKLVLCVVFLSACDNRNAIPAKKPFIVTYKYPKGARCSEGYCSYEFTDSNNNVFHFCDKEQNYKIGDTLQ